MSITVQQVPSITHHTVTTIMNKIAGTKENCIAEQIGEKIESYGMLQE